MMKFQARFFYILFLLTCIFSAACSDAPAPANSNTNQTTVNTNSINTANINTAPSPAASVSPANTAAGSPSATVAAYQQALFKKDEAAFRRAISEASAREISVDATAEKKTLVQLWAEYSEPTQAAVETRNERVSGEAAYIETQNPKTGKWSLNKLVREKGEWKMDLTSATAGELLKQQK